MTTPEPVNPYAAEAPTGPNTLARVSFVIAIVLVVVAIVLQFVSRFAPLLMVNLGWDTTQISILFGVFSFVDLILGVVGLVFGLVGARRPGLTLQAGIGIGVGGFVALTALISLISAPLIGLFY